MSLAAQGLLLLALACRAQPPVPRPGEPPIGGPPSPFVGVFVDRKTEEGALGLYPYDRAVYAKALELLKSYGARAVVLQFFLDQPREGPGDELLTKAMSGLPVYLQAMVTMSEDRPNPFPKNLAWKGQSMPFSQAIAGDRGWIPLSRFSAVSRGIGFTDIRDPRRPELIPMLGRFRGLSVKSLWLLGLEAAFAQEGRLDARDRMLLGGRPLPVSEYGETAVDLDHVRVPPCYPFVDLWKGRLKPKAFKDKVVVLGYTGSKAESVVTVGGKRIPAHEAFLRALQGLYEQARL